MKAVLMIPSEVALPVFSYAQMVRANCVMVEASTEINCPAQTRINPVIPVRLLLDVVIKLDYICTCYNLFMPVVLDLEIREGSVHHTFEAEDFGCEMDFLRSVIAQGMAFACGR